MFYILSYCHLQIAIDKNDLDKAYIQLTIEFVGKQVEP